MSGNILPMLDWCNSKKGTFEECSACFHLSRHNPIIKNERSFINLIIKLHSCKHLQSYTGNNKTVYLTVVTTRLMYH